MIRDARPRNYQGDINWNGLVQLCEGYDPPDQQWQALVQGPAGYEIRITKGAHHATYYAPPYNTDYYFDFKTYDDTGESATEYHALLNAHGTAIIGIEPNL